MAALVETRKRMRSLDAEQQTAMDKIKRERARVLSGLAQSRKTLKKECMDGQLDDELNVDNCWRWAVGQAVGDVRQDVPLEVGGLRWKASDKLSWVESHVPSVTLTRDGYVIMPVLTESVLELTVRELNDTGIDGFIEDDVVSIKTVSGPERKPHDRTTSKYHEYMDVALADLISKFVKTCRATQMVDTYRHLDQIGFAEDRCEDLSSDLATVLSSATARGGREVTSVRHHIGESDPVELNLWVSIPVHLVVRELLAYDRRRAGREASGGGAACCDEEVIIDDESDEEAEEADEEEAEESEAEAEAGDDESEDETRSLDAATVFKWLLRRSFCTEVLRA